jgi:hypothetical protein
VEFFVWVVTWFLVFRVFFLRTITSWIWLIGLDLRAFRIHVRKLNIAQILDSIDLTEIIYWNVSLKKFLINLGSVFTHFCFFLILFFRRIFLLLCNIRRYSLIFNTWGLFFILICLILSLIWSLKLLIFNLFLFFRCFLWYYLLLYLWLLIRFLRAINF